MRCENVNKSFLFGGAPEQRLVAAILRAGGRRFFMRFVSVAAAVALLLVSFLQGTARAQDEYPNLKIRCSAPRN